VTVSASTRSKRMHKLAKKIERHEDKFDMGSWFNDYSKLSEAEVIKKIIEKRRPICGTTGCAAGWAVFMFGTKKQIRHCIENDGDWGSVAQDLLGMTGAEACLFGRSHAEVEAVAHDLRDMARRSDPRN
jgi:ArsR family metal-binding transcriptional regulator